MKSNASIRQKNGKRGEWAKDFKQNGTLYLLVLPVLAYYILFCYRPMYGTLIAFESYSPRLGFFGSEWIGLENFKSFFQSADFTRILGNTLRISIKTLLVTFPSPIILALLINEMRCERLKKFVQTTSYLPHFISLVVICGMIKDFVAQDGIVTMFAGLFGFGKKNMLLDPKLFDPVYVISAVWQSIGWDSIIYLAALSAVDVEQYEAADIDGAGRFAKMFYITFPSIQPTIITMLILRVGQVMSLGYEKIILLYNPSIYSTSDVISSYVYRIGFETQNWGYSAAVGLFNSVINTTLLLATNTLSKKMTETSLW